MTQVEAQERVARGAALLDEKRPGWERRINIKTLKIDSCLNCVIGQLYSTGGKFSRFSEGLMALGLPSADHYGFGVNERDDDTPEVWQWLQTAWLEAIAARLNTPSIAWTMREQTDVTKVEV